MRTVGATAVVLGLMTFIPASATAQDRPWVAEVSVGWAGFVDDATKNYFLIGGSVRRHLTPRVSIGPEIVVMRNSSNLTDPIVVMNGNIVYDFREPSPNHRVTPFLVAGGGVMWGRDDVNNGPFWWTDPSFTGGVGVRGRVSDAISAGAEYRLGWELNQRLSGLIGVHW